MSGPDFVFPRDPTAGERSDDEETDDLHDEDLAQAHVHSEHIDEHEDEAPEVLDNPTIIAAAITSTVTNSSSITSSSSSSSSSSVKSGKSPPRDRILTWSVVKSLSSKIAPPLCCASLHSVSFTPSTASLLLLGGRNIPSTNSSSSSSSSNSKFDFHLFDISSASWLPFTLDSAATLSPAALCAHASTMADTQRKVYVFGGVVKSQSFAFEGKSGRGTRANEATSPKVGIFAKKELRADSPHDYDEEDEDLQQEQVRSGSDDGQISEEKKPGQTHDPHHDRKSSDFSGPPSKRILSNVPPKLRWIVRAREGDTSTLPRLRSKALALNPAVEELSNGLFVLELPPMLPSYMSSDGLTASSSATIAQAAMRIQWKAVELAASSLQPTPRAFSSLTHIPERNSILLVGGATRLDLRRVEEEMMEFDVERNEWKKISPNAGAAEIMSPRFGHSATYIGRGLVLFFGGISLVDGRERRLNDLHLFSTETCSFVQLTFSKTSSIPLARAFHSAALVGTHLYVIGGEGDRLSTDCAVLDISGLLKDGATGKERDIRWFRPLYEGQIEQHMCASTAVDDKIVLYGGLNVAAMSDDSMYLNSLSFVSSQLIDSSTVDNDLTFKIVIAGDAGTGKSSLLNRFVSDTYDDNITSTIGVDFSAVITMAEGRLCKAQLWDTAGQERFATVSLHYYRGADAVVLVYDVTNRTSFEHIKQWMENVLTANGMEEKNCTILFILVGNKADMSSRRVGFSEGADLAKQLRFGFFLETSAKDTYNVDLIFMHIAKQLVGRKVKGKSSTRGGGLKLSSLSSESYRERRGCCK